MTLIYDTHFRYRTERLNRLNLIKSTANGYCWGSRDRFLIHMFSSFVSDLWVGSHQIYTCHWPTVHLHIHIWHLLWCSIVSFSNRVWHDDLRELAWFWYASCLVCRAVTVALWLLACWSSLCIFPAGHNERETVIMGCVLPNSSMPAFSYR